MKFYEVELKRVSYVTLQIEANDPDEAESLAWEELSAGESYGLEDGGWTHESTTEQELATDESRSNGPHQ